MPILVDYILTLYPQHEFVNNDVFLRLKQCLTSFTNHQMPYDNAKSIIQSLNLTVDPLEKLNRILNIGPAQASPHGSRFKPVAQFKKNNQDDSSNSGSQDQNDSVSSDSETLKDYENTDESENEFNDSKNHSKSTDDSAPTRRRSHCWTTSEDERLLAAIHRYGLDNWSSVAIFVGNSRTRSQCSQRWTRGIDPRLSKNLWTHEEENLLFQLVSIYGNRSWTLIANKLGNRSDVQCRYHYKQIHRDLQTHAKSAENFLNNNSSLMQNLFRNQQTQPSIQDAQNQILNQRPQFQIQNQQPQFQPQQLQFQNQQLYFQNQLTQFQPQLNQFKIQNQQAQLHNMNMGMNQLNQQTNNANYNTLNGLPSGYPMNKDINNPIATDFRPNFNSFPNSFQSQMGNTGFIPQQPQMNIMNWPSNNPIPQQQFSFSNCQQFSHFHAPAANMNTTLVTKSEDIQRMQANQNSENEHLYFQSTSYFKANKPIQGSTIQSINSCDQNASTNHEVLNQQKLNNAEIHKMTSSNDSSKQSISSSSSSSSNEPAIFELDDSDLFSKEAMAFFSIPSEKDFLFF